MYGGIYFSSFLFLLSVVLKPTWMLSLLGNACWHWWGLSKVKRLLNARKRFPKAASSWRPWFPQLWSVVEPFTRRRMELAAVLWGRTMVTFNDSGQGEKFTERSTTYSSSINSIGWVFSKEIWVVCGAFFLLTNPLLSHRFDLWTQVLNIHINEVFIQALSHPALSWQRRKIWFVCMEEKCVCRCVLELPSVHLEVSYLISKQYQ